MAEKALPRLTRLLGIVHYLDIHGEATIEELATQFDTGAKQIRADIDTLWVSGLPGYGTDDLIDFDPWLIDEGTVRLTKSQGVKQVRMGAREAVALVGALSSLVASGAAPAPAESALDKLRGAISNADAVTVVKDSTVRPDVRTALLDAVARRRVTTIDYVDATDRKSERAIEPHRLVAIDGVGYVECYCRRAGDYRTLRLDRIASARVTEEAVVTPPSDAKGFSLTPRYRAAVSLHRSARWAVEDLPGVTLASEGDTVRAAFGVADEAWIASRLLCIAPHLITVAPDSLRSAVHATATSVLEAAAWRADGNHAPGQ